MGQFGAESMMALLMEKDLSCMKSTRGRRAWIAMALLFGALIFQSVQLQAQTSQFKGWRPYVREISVRVAPQNRLLVMDRFLPAQGLEVLLGTWNNFGSEHTFQNGTPNPVSMLIWNVTLTRFADHVARSCNRSSAEWNSFFQAKLERICRWPAAEARSEETMKAYWLAWMGHSAPEEEYLEWRDFFLNTDIQDLESRSAISNMTLAILMNPYLLLSR